MIGSSETLGCGGCDGSGAEGWNKRTLGGVGFGMQGNKGGWL
jgi:hypothetical protein